MTWRPPSAWLVRALVFQFLTMMPVNAIRPMVSYRALELGSGAVDLGLLASSYAILPLLFAVPLGGAVDRIGEPRFLILGSTTIAGVAFALTGSTSVVLLAVAQALLGLGQIVCLIGLQAFVSNVGDPDDRDRRIGWLSVNGAVGQMVGPAAAGYLFALAGDSLETVFLASGACALLAVAVGVSIHVLPTPRVEQRDPRVAREPLYRTAREVLRLPMVPNAMLASVAVLTSIDLLIAYLPLYGELNGLAVQTVGVLLAVRAGAGVASRVLMMPLLHRFGRQRLLAWSMAIPAASLLALPLIRGPLLLGLAMAAAGFGLGLGQPLSLAWVMAQVPVRMRGMAIGVRLTGNRLGQLVLPALAGVLAASGGVMAIFVSSGGLLAVSAVVVRARQVKERARVSSLGP